jgi:hypothetical protein
VPFFIAGVLVGFLFEVIGESFALGRDIYHSLFGPGVSK